MPSWIRDERIAILWQKTMSGLRRAKDWLGVALALLLGAIFALAFKIAEKLHT